MRFAFSTVLLVLPAALAAQQPPPAPAPAPDTVELKPVVVTATRIPTPADAVPAAVTVISGAELLEQGIRTVAEALRTVPAAHVVVTDGYGSQTSLFLRGGESDYVKVLIDGVPQNARPPGGAYDFADLTTDNVERIEIVRGPVSVLYGSDAVTGVVQVFTREGRGAAHGSVTVSGGPGGRSCPVGCQTYGNSELAATVAGGDERAGYAFGASRFVSDGVYAVDNQYRNEVLTGLVRLRPDDYTDATLSLRYGDALYHFPTDGGGAVVSNNQHQLDRGPSVGLDLGRAFSARVEGRITAGWHRDDYQYAIAPNGPADTTTFPYSSSDRVTREGLDARANVRLARSDVLTTGLAFEREAMQGTTLAGAPSRNDGAVYLQLATARERAANFTLGARLDDNQRFGTYATYRAGLSVRLDGRTRAIASVGTGFKEPTFYQNFVSGYARGNPDLKPEHSFSWEAGLEYAAPRSPVTVRATYYDQRFRDLIQYSGAPVGPDSVNYVNVAEAAARGVELAVQAALGPGLSLDATYTYLDSRDLATNQRLQRRPTHTGSLQLGYRIAARGSASLVAAFTGDRDDYDYSTYPAPRVTLPPHTRVDVAGTYDVLRGHAGAPGLALDLRIENLLDAAYQDVKNFPARGRTLLFGGQLRFGS
jgi:vitamin B12 transporter